MPEVSTGVFIHPRFEDEYARHPLVLVDVGARGGLKPNWGAATRHLRVLGFEPDRREFSRLTADPRRDPSITFFDVALHNRKGPVRLHVARDPGLTSIFEPDRAFLDSFPEADRFDTVSVQEVEADALDNVLHAHDIADVDFMKVDTQGSELLVLQGASSVLDSTVTGVEVEVEFSPIYKGQPLYADVDAFLRAQGFLLFDLRPCYWKRAAGRGVGGPMGQIIWADALYLKTLPALTAAVGRLGSDLRKSKALRAISIALLYGYYDYALEIARVNAAQFEPDERVAIDQRLRRDEGRFGAAARLPGRRYIAAALHRMWSVFRQRDDAWSISKPKIGNL